MSDKLEEIVRLQTEFMKLLGDDPAVIPSNAVNDKLVIMSVALADEAFEILRECDWKTWKKPKGLSVGKAREEVIDALHFVVEMSILLQMSADDIFKEYSRKMHVNIERQKGGY